MQNNLQSFLVFVSSVVAFTKMFFFHFPFSIFLNCDHKWLDVNVKKHTACVETLWIFQKRALEKSAEMIVFVRSKSNKRCVISVEGLNIACQCIEENNKLCFHLRPELTRLFILADTICQKHYMSILKHRQMSVCLLQSCMFAHKGAFHWIITLEIYSKQSYTFYLCIKVIFTVFSVQF